jgi:hypothetical protein
MYKGSKSSEKSRETLEQEFKIISDKARNNTNGQKRLWILIDEFNTSCH